MPALSKIALVAAAALIGGARAGVLTTTAYTDSQCTVRATECGAHNAALPADGSDCDPTDMTDIPVTTTEWVSGECAACSGLTDEACSYPFFDMSDEEGQALLAHGVNPAFAKITCTAGVATVEHFSDPECTAANRVTNDEITTGLRAVMNDMLAAQNMPPQMQECLTIELDFQSGIGISGTHCDPITTMTWDEVRHRFLTTTRAMWAFACVL
jgi:hypothetical protein